MWFLLYINLLSLIDYYDSYFKKILHAFAQPPSYTKYVQIPAPNQDAPVPQLQNNSKLWPFFSHCIGAIDGSHIPLSAKSSTDKEAF
ncbi:hypothetical protein P691DRAFT_675226 [Macrolepiota fuliginosa MF-IS2]|uniref:DDE Tnp4 domain-containing protein n=1 Tax=Macrolepiota fuliginosa MF-IS2 TaxID=1400762 RepID=A0A9P5X6B7_9AGAR|nr:hypothetical protein P691DRAFT_675226 [Macrolepiota fuliginosa MF-IS2]